MWEIILSGGGMMVPIIIASVLAMGITLERFWTLRASKIAPSNLLAQVWGWMKNNQLDASKIRMLGSSDSSALGRVLAAGLVNSRHGRQIMKESIEEVASHEIHEMERYLNALGTVAAVAPLMGLLGTVFGMIQVFSEIMAQGTGQANVLAGGISEALITTELGLIVAIPAVFFGNLLKGWSENLKDSIESQALDHMNSSLLLCPETELVERREIDYPALRARPPLAG